ncbi:acyl-CoA thioesterase [Herpetosiphon giganteus]|uniref:acyl-CoA thioesterase n=1 Tax=Herpetosiphon giganteus TaxID=2029754 RepID=UPI00195AE8D6|nr:thioesterase family protein [Herpetosiphon giganteus]MBM7842329.1 acyl-CoA thioester hydrolase [Herpetosiphon giganteus]
MAFEYPIEVRFRDLDGLGHVNNAVYLTYFETLRLQFAIELLGAVELADVPFILGEATVRYLMPVFFGDQLQGSVEVSRIGTKSFTMLYTLKRGNEIVTQGSTELIWFDFKSQRSVPIPDSFRQQVATYQGA